MFKKMRNWGITVSLFFAVLGASGCLGLVWCGGGVGVYLDQRDLVRNSTCRRKTGTTRPSAFSGAGNAIMEESDRLGKSADFADGTRLDYRRP